MKVLININEPEKELFVVTDDVGIEETVFGYIVKAGSKEPIHQCLILKNKENYKWVKKENNKKESNYGIKQVA